ncbi:hypothetical protein [Streptomyces sp. H27-D2]|uniref:hypothetical protein n=1 Tax=Streptomyces sp. H27-D2 TaxID=3046304 RepID=UPI002DBD1753|nr:hypothetical protein [Streptomyces sp. H27-D2]MEC4017699.1 hypothetical protein [Streptomyces sp. H27-D2]
MRKTSPWAPRGSGGRPPATDGRGLWAEPDPKTPVRSRATRPHLEGDLEGGDA